MGVTLTPNLTPNLGSFLLLRKSSFNSRQSGVKITQKMGSLSDYLYYGEGNENGKDTIRLD